MRYGASKHTSSASVLNCWIIFIYSGVKVHFRRLFEMVWNIFDWKRDFGLKIRNLKPSFIYIWPKNKHRFLCVCQDFKFFRIQRSATNIQCFPTKPLDAYLIFPADRSPWKRNPSIYVSSSILSVSEAKCTICFYTAVYRFFLVSSQLNIYVYLKLCKHV